MLNKNIRQRIDILYKEFLDLYSGEPLEPSDVVDILRYLPMDSRLFRICKQISYEVSQMERIEDDRLWSCREWKRKNKRKIGERVFYWKQKVKMLKFKKALSKEEVSAMQE